MRKLVPIAAAIAVIVLLGLVAGGAGTQSPTPAPSPATPPLAGFEVFANYQLERGNADERKARKGIPRIPRFRTSAIQRFVAC